MVSSKRVESKLPDYPYLASTGKLVILISCKTRNNYLTGMVVHSIEGSPFPVGCYSETWNEDELRRTSDAVTLING